MSCEVFFLEELRRRGYRLTPQREMVLAAVHALPQAASAEEIHAQVARQSSSIELSTIYRTLDLLNELGLVTRIEMGDRQRMYELARHRLPHLHAVCRACGTILSVDLDVLQPLFSHLDAIHFTADRTNITISGLCTACENTSAGPAPDEL